MAIRVLVSGNGKMGREVLATACREKDLEPVGVVDLFAGEEYISLPVGSGLIPFGSKPAAIIRRTRPDVVVDFTNAEWTPVLAHEALAAGVRLVIGTSGLQDAFLKELGAECRKKKIGAVVASNFAIGAVLMQHLAKLAGKHFEYAEIIELHHEGKVDAPSGTAIATAKTMAAGRKKGFVRNQAKKQTVRGTRGGNVDGISIHSIRLPGLVAHQEVILGGQGETLSIRHDSTSRESFMPGVLMAVRYVMNNPGLTMGLEGLLGLDRRAR
jgi:4-hydroxy-tetrahydrodipicolinate reductase